MAPSLLPFHANLLQAAVMADAPVQPVGLRFIDRATGRPSAAALYVGDDTLVHSALARTVRRRPGGHRALRAAPACSGPRPARVGGRPPAGRGRTAADLTVPGPQGRVDGLEVRGAGPPRGGRRLATGMDRTMDVLVVA